MGKNLFIAEKPSVAREFAKALQITGNNRDGYIESNDAIVTWCVGHLVTMSYPEVYDEKYKRWSLNTIPFIPTEFKYEVIDSVKKQFQIVSGLLNREDVETIYVCTDSGREGEYIYRLVERQANVHDKTRRRVWIDSQTEEEILRGIREARDLSEYDNLCAAAYLRAKEDYLMGINFSRVLTLKYGNAVKDYLKLDRAVVSVGRVMTCVLGMVVNREREIRNFEKTPFFRVVASVLLGERGIDCEWRAVEGTPYFASPLLYKENGFKEREPAENLIQYLLEEPRKAIVHSIEKKKENKNAPLLYNLAELQNDCSKYFKISPDETLRIAQELYEKGLKFSENAKKDLEVLGQAVEDIVNTAYEVFDKQDMKLAEKIEPLEEVIDELSKEVKRRHVQRLRNGECTIEMGFILSDITTCLERVADHCSNIGVCVTQVNEDLYDTHSHLNIVKSHPDETFYHELEDARIKYQLS